MIVLSTKRKQRIDDVLANIPARIGKTVVTIEVNCGMAGKVNAMKLKYFTEEDVQE